MKIRIGFVSNSSTSSFIVLGVQLKDFQNFEEIKKVLDDVDIEYDFDGLKCFDKLEIFYSPYDWHGEMYVGLKNVEEFLENHSVKDGRKKFYEIATKNGLVLDDENKIKLMAIAYDDH